MPALEAQVVQEQRAAPAVQAARAARRQAPAGRRTVAAPVQARVARRRGARAPGLAAAPDSVAGVRAGVETQAPPGALVTQVRAELRAARDGPVRRE
jgi:hypothetical protein